MPRILVYIACLLLWGGLSAQNVPKTPVLEKFTSVACGNCGNASLILEDLVADHPELIAVAHHVSIFDSMMIPEAVETFQYFSGGTPTACVNRGSSAITTSGWEAKVVSAKTETSNVDLSIKNVSYDELTKLVEIELEATFLQADAGDFRFNLWVTENNVYKNGTGWWQRNYYNNTPGHPLEGKGHPIKDFVHQHVLRLMLDGAWGLPDSIPTTISANTTYTKHYEFTVPTYMKAGDLELVAILQAHGSGVSNRKLVNAKKYVLSQLVGVEVELPIEKLKIFPQPSTGLVQLDLGEIFPEDILVEVFDLQGKRILKNDIRSGESRLELRLESQSPGMYFLKLSAPGFSRTTRLLLVE